MSTVYATIRIERGGQEIRLEVSGELHPAERGTRDDPGCEATVDDVAAVDGTELSAAEEFLAGEALLDEGWDRSEPDPDDARDSRRDDW